jgi:hypothetical protein
MTIAGAPLACSAMAELIVRIKKSATVRGLSCRRRRCLAATEWCAGPLLPSMTSSLRRRDGAGPAGGFYGLVAEGWNLTDFGKPWPRGPVPAARSRPSCSSDSSIRSRRRPRWMPPFNPAQRLLHERASRECATCGCRTRTGASDAGLFAQWAALPAETLGSPHPVREAVTAMFVAQVGQYHVLRKPNPKTGSAAIRHLQLRAAALRHERDSILQTTRMSAPGQSPRRDDVEECAGRWLRRAVCPGARRNTTCICPRRDRSGSHIAAESARLAGQGRVIVLPQCLSA